MQEPSNAMASSSTSISAGPVSSQETKVDGPTIRPKRAPKPPTSRSSVGSSSTVRPRPSGHESSRKAKATFTTVRSYPEVAPVPLLQASIEEENLQRSQRKSKVHAINKMDRVGTPIATDGPTATSFIPPPPPPAGPSILRNPLHRPHVPNPPFDINTVRQEGPRYPPPRTEPRMFGLEECPTFYPTMEEFTDPMEYISSIGPQGRQYGIAKIVPPEGWRMPFTLPTDKFRFKTRLQRLNSLEAASRAKVNFLEQLSMFHKQQGNANATIPIIERKTVDLWRLRKEVNKVGGVLTLDRIDGWADVTETMGYGRHSAIHIKNAYKEVVQPFDEWSIRAKASLSQSPLRAYQDAASIRPPVFKDEPGSPSKKARMSGMRSMPRPSMDSLLPPIKIKLTNSLSKSASVPIKLDSHTGSSISSSNPEILLNGAAEITKTPTVKIRVPGFSSAGGDDSDLSSEASSPDPPTPPPLPKYVKGDVCEICRHGHAASKILLCDGCDRGFHIYCLDPPLAAVPTNEEWFCSACLFSQGDDFGFEEGDEHSIPSFQARDAAFAHAWWNSHRPGPSSGSDLHRTFGKVAVTESDVEREFWRLTDSTTETVEIEYGADVHSTTHGSAAPTKEDHPLNKYSDDPWNLNNMPIVKESLLRYIKSDISGMTVPWIYLGMLFSAFCWHNEDHYTYSVNYMHWGETKTWYGVPGEDADKFEEAIKSEAPELFEQQPALLYQLVTMMNPGRLQELGVKVVGCDQRPNEFVITWPKAYHCGFNHGINFNEAVNFALPDWLSQGKDCVLRYKQHAKQPVFSHNELLITITLFSDTIKTALWLKDSLAEMVQQETARRDRLRAEIPLLAESLVEEDCPEEQYQCCICKGFCYLSQMTCSCTKLVACIEHADQLCGCAKSKRTLRKRYSENQLEEILSAVEIRASQPSNWLERLDGLLEVPRPSLKTMRTLLADGERISYPMPEVEHLRALVDRANAWVEKVAALGQRKSTGRRRKGRHDDNEELDRSPDALRALLQEVEKLAFDSPEIFQLRQVLHDIESFKQQADMILSTPDDDLHLEQCRTALILGKSINIDMPQIAALQTVVDRLLWFKKVDEDVDDRTLSLANVLELIGEAQACGVPADHITLVELRERQVTGQAWKDSVQRLFAQPKITVEDISALVEGQELVPTDIDTMRQLEVMKKTAQTWQASASALLSGNGTSNIAQRLLKQIKIASGPTSRLYFPEIGQLQAEMDFQAKWLAQIATLLGCQKPQVAATLSLLLQLAENGLDPEDDTPKEDWATCFCRGQPTDMMVKCDECAGSYHPKCVGLTVKQVDRPFTCEMCSTPYDPSRASVNALGGFADSNKWNFIIPPVEMETAGLITRLFVRYAKTVMDIANPRDKVDPCRDVKLIVHHLRKIYNIPLLFDAHDYETNTIVIFEHWLQRRWREAVEYAIAAPKRPAAPSGTSNRRTADAKYTRSRKPKFVLKESHEGELSCICSTPPFDHLLVVNCSRCRQGYHASCVHCPPEMMTLADSKWKCPCCTVRAGQHYSRNVELRVQMTADKGTNQYVDYRATLKYFAEAPIKMELPPTPITALSMITLECIQFVEPYIPEDQERDEAGQPKKKARIGPHGSLAPGDGRDESTNGGSPASQHTVAPSTSVFAIPPVVPVPSTSVYAYPPNQPTSNSTSTATTYRPDCSASHGDPTRPEYTQGRSMLEASRVQPYTPRPPQPFAPYPRPTAPAVGHYSASPWSSISSPYQKPSSPMLPQVPNPAHPVNRPQVHAYAHTPNSSQINGTTITPNATPPVSSASISVPPIPTAKAEPSHLAYRPVNAAEQNAKQAELERQTKETEMVKEEQKEKDAQAKRERERQWDDMRARAASIVETVRKEGINGGGV